MMLGQKIQIGIVFLVLAAAGYFFFHNSQQTFDMSVNSWTFFRPVGIDKLKKISLQNPEDPKKQELVNGFGCADGQVEIKEYPNDPNRHPMIAFTPEKRGGPRKYRYFQDSLAPIDSVKNPFKRALTLATYHQVYQSPLGLLGGVGLNPQQLQEEAQARQVLNSSVASINAAVDTGTFHAELMDKVMKALATYKAKSGDPQKDAKKAELARNLLEQAAAFYNRILQEKDAAIDRYMDAISGKMDASQQARLIEAVKQWESQQQGAKGNAKPAPIPPPARGPTSLAPPRNGG